MGDTALQCLSAGPSKSADTRPIMILLKSLIRNKQNTIMTNAQIIDILQKEFNIDVDSRHELEVDIFIKIIKKYLKDWPQWEDLERVSSRLGNLKDYDAIDKVLNHKYKNLKEYLGARLDIAKEAVQNIEDIKDDENGECSKQESDDVDSDVVMEIHCTRDELNHLIIKHPNDMIFNTQVVEPSRIQYSTLTLEQILNLWCYKIVIFLPWFIYIRKLQHNYKHILVNKARKPATEQYNFMSLLWQRKNNARVKEIDRGEVLKKIEKYLVLLKTTPICTEIVEVVFKMIIDSFEDGPVDVKVPSLVRRHCSNYKYVRYLYLDNDMNDTNKNSKYDLQLEESIAPMIHYYINKFSDETVALPGTLDWFKIECLQCGTEFVGATNAISVVNHYKDCHVNNEPDWQCSRCKRIFSIGYLAENMWHHDC